MHCIDMSTLLTEVVLSVLVKAFKFSLTEREIYWNWASVDYHTMDGETTEPSLVLNVEPLRA